MKFADNHNRTGNVSGRLTAKPGKYRARFSASDGIHPAVSKTVQITITPPELSVKIARSVRVSKGRIAVGCVVLSRILRSCKVTVFIGRKKVGSATVRIRRRGKRSTTVTIKFSGNDAAAHRQAQARAEALAAVVGDQVRLERGPHRERHHDRAASVKRKKH